MRHTLPILLVCVVAGCGGSGAGPQVPATPTTQPIPTPTSTPTTTPTPTPTTPAPTPTTPNVDNASFSGLLNNVRATNGASPVAFNARLSNAAQAHANDMLANDYFSHTGLNGSSPGDRIQAAGYDWQTYGENIAQGHPSQEAVFEGWTNSPGHHANNINPNFEDFGLAKAGTGGDARWVLVLAAKR